MLIRNLLVFGCVALLTGRTPSAVVGEHAFSVSGIFHSHFEFILRLEINALYIFKSLLPLSNRFGCRLSFNFTMSAFMLFGGYPEGTYDG